MVTASSTTMSSASITSFSAAITPSGVSGPLSGRSAGAGGLLPPPGDPVREPPATSGWLSAIRPSSAAMAASPAGPSAWTATSTG